MTSPGTFSPGRREQLDVLNSLLKDEQQALLEADYDRLPELTQAKITLLQEISAMQAQESSGETPGTTTPELRESLLQAREINRANGHLIGGALHYVQDALGVLRGHSAVTYDSRGHTGASCNGRVPLGRA